ncbi:MAG: UDP-N-acetylglucosamine 2-epimerase (non-hydrolyzing) [Armatimonadetes bacterium]|nr:UDP-N-acetylglucosamine 2-epimerase (non-hydrolyzing) [Armatimonadota bacterium]
MTDAPLAIMTVFGTRPEAVKMAPVIQALRARPGEFRPITVVTAQHREMLDQVLRLFHIMPDHDLNVMQPEQSLAEITVRALEGLDRVLREVRPALVLVQGDASSTFVGALAAFYHSLPIGHIEAGLRTSNKYHPFPEEMNRRMTTSLADLHFAPTAWARDNLLREAIPRDAIYVTGNTVIDALRQVAAAGPFPPEAGLPDLDGRFLLVETHRRENWGDPQRQICLALRDLLDRFADLRLIFSVHRNPVVRRVVYGVMEGHPRALLMEPPDYGPFVQLMTRATLILTDSGGIQEEAPALGTPVLVLRQTTERPEGVAAGTVRLVGTDRERIVVEVSHLLTDQDAYRRMATAVNPYGDGQASRRIVEAIRYFFGRSSTRPEEFGT